MSGKRNKEEEAFVWVANCKIPPVPPNVLSKQRKNLKEPPMNLKLKAERHPNLYLNQGKS